MSPLWQKVYDANYHKSLDHRSFYFKQTDKRLLGAKGMIGDIRGACHACWLFACHVHDDYDSLIPPSWSRSRHCISSRKM